MGVVGAVREDHRDGASRLGQPLADGAPDAGAAADATLVPLAEPVCPIRRQIWLVMHPDVKRSPRVRVVADLLVEVVAGAQALLAGAPPSACPGAAPIP